MTAAITSLDFSLLYWIQAHMRNDFFDGFFKLVTHLGDAGIFWIALGIILLCFPKTRRSGHSASSFTAATAVFFHYRKAGIAAYILAALIAFSRLYCYVHFPTDVLTGIALGLCVGIVLVPRLSRQLAARSK